MCFPSIVTRLLAVLAFVLAQTSSALTPGPTIIRECPDCRAPVRQRTIGSGNTFGAKFWTDGKMEAPMLPSFPRLVKCPKCAALFWVQTARKLHEAQNAFDAVPPKFKDAAEPTAPTEKELLAFGAANKLEKNDEIYVRRTAWWLANDSVRHGGKPAGRLSPERQANMRALARLLDEKTAPERLLCAEIARELGDFTECKRLLGFEFPERFRKRAALIGRLADEKNTTVAQDK